MLLEKQAEFALALASEMQYLHVRICHNNDLSCSISCGEKEWQIYIIHGAMYALLLYESRASVSVVKL